ncbi:P-loop NTPase fold protein [Nocardia barduliensis]|uniref:P-loop NTPase fold protein n=1 Tax=Nocardia barduliensis TaxID=2736643 RepID=UPI0015741F64|nr:P-loop NTPase fold protein [Nocardia barduliensis]
MAVPNGDILGDISGVRYSVARTERPWEELAIDSIVVSVGGSLGSLGRAVSRQHPRAPWDAVPFDRIRADQPFVLDLPPSPESSLRQAILVTPRDQANDLGDVTEASLRAAARSSVEAAAANGARSLGLPLLGTGVLAEPAQRVAAVLVPAVVEALQAQGAARPEQLVFLCRTAELEETIRQEFQRLTQAGVFELAGGVARDLVNPNVGIPLSEDRLGFGPYVSMLATVMADRTTPLPLSIGLFGEWGSGKSYFMAMLRERVRVLAASGDDRYCAEIVQIGFNAWHYADTNLWASLGDEIFRQLAGSGPSAQQRAEQIRAELADRLEQRHQLQTATREARAVAASLQAEVDRAVAEREASARDLLTALRNSGVFQAKVDSLWRKLGIADEIEQAKLLSDQMHGTLTEAGALRRAASERNGRIALTVAAGLLVLGVSAAFLAPAIREVLVAVVGVVTVCTGGLGLAFLKRARDGLQDLREVTEDVRSEMSRAAVATVHEDMAETLNRLRAAEADQRVAQAQLEDVVAHVGELGRQLAELTPGRRLYTFLAERADSASYTGSLGLVSTIRKDFEQLIELMADWQARPEEWETRRPVDRIVLYIDDLDRCRPDQVVDVLQAVHLLLAFELFIVVVGVDPQWLLRSLHSRYAELLGDGAFGDPADTRHTPEDYLEKILNIPLVLPGMPSGSLERFLRAIDEEDGSPPIRATYPRVGVAPLRLPDPVDGGSVDPAAITVERGSEVDRQRSWAVPVDRLWTLTESEIQVLAALDLLIDTPREAKRLINLYRMVRATRDLSDASRFLGVDGSPGEYQAVVVLLGLLTAHARLLDSVLYARPDRDGGIGGGLAHRPSEQLWSSFVDDVEPRRSADGWTNRIIGPLPESRLPQWNRLHSGLVGISAVADLRDLSDLHTWLPRIRRFSYTLSATRSVENRTG